MRSLLGTGETHDLLDVVDEVLSWCAESSNVNGLGVSKSRYCTGTELWNFGTPCLCCRIQFFGGGLRSRIRSATFHRQKFPHSPGTVVVSCRGGACHLLLPDVNVESYTCLPTLKHVKSS